MLKITPTNDIYQKNNFYSALIYGEPGIGKSTFVASASNPLLIDCECGAHRMKSKDLFNCSVVSVNSFEELMNITLDDVSQFETIIFDTFGSLVLKAMQWICKSSTPSIKQWGLVLNQVLWLLHKFTGHKNVIATAHTTVQNKGLNDDDIKILPYAQGSAIDLFITECDFIGYMYWDKQKQRILSFEPTDKFVTKNTKNFPHTIIIPDNSESNGNSLYPNLIEKHLNKFTQEEIKVQKDMQELKNRYDELWQNISSKIMNASTPEQFTEIYNMYHSYEDIFNLHARAYFALQKRNQSFAFKFDRQTNSFIHNQEEEEKLNENQ